MLNKNDILTMIGTGILIVVAMEALVMAITGSGVILR